MAKKTSKPNRRRGGRCRHDRLVSVRVMERTYLYFHVAEEMDYQRAKGQMPRTSVVPYRTGAYPDWKYVVTCEACGASEWNNNNAGRRVWPAWCLRAFESVRQAHPDAAEFHSLPQPATPEEPADAPPAS